MPAHPTHYITPQGHRRLVDELDHLRKVERPRVVQEVADAAAMGDRSENAEYIYGKRRLREIDRRMRWLNQRLDAAVIVDPEKQSGDRVRFGASVKVEDEAGEVRTFRLVGEDETEPQAGLISYRSPLGAALLGKRLDDEVEVTTPSGVRSYLVVGIAFSGA